MPVSSIPIAPVIATTPAPSNAARAKPAGGLQPDFQSVLSGQTPTAVTASGSDTPGTLASALAIERTVAPQAASKAFGAATPVPALPPKAPVTVAAASSSPATKGSPKKTTSATPQTGMAPPSGAPVPPPMPALPLSADVAAAAGVAVPPTPGTVASIVASSGPLPSTPGTIPLAAPSLLTGPVLSGPAATAVASLGISDARPDEASTAPAVSGAALIPEAAVGAPSPANPLAAVAFAAAAVPGTLASIVATPLVNRQGSAVAAPGSAPSAPGATVPAVGNPTPVVAASAAAPLPSSPALIIPGSSAAPAPASAGTGFRAQTGSGEKFAESAATPGTAPVDNDSKPNKHSFNINGEQVTNPADPIGTSIAFPTPAMTSSATAQALFAAPASSAQALSTPGGESAPPVVALASASEAVESVLQIGDLQAAQAQATQASVSLHFTVGGENLSVRVGLQEGQVHTQFSTDSNDLRVALAHEWGALGSTSTGSVRFAEPVFTSGNRGEPKAGGDLAGDSGQQANRGRDQAQAGEGSPTSAKAPRSTPATVAVGAVSPNPAEPLVMGRLHSFA
jgi:hypothetical protein